MSIYTRYLRPLVMWLGELYNPGITERRINRQRALDVSQQKLVELNKAREDFIRYLDLLREAMKANQSLEAQNNYRLLANEAHHRFYSISSELDDLRAESRLLTQ